MKSYKSGEYYAAVDLFDKLYEIEKSKQKKGKWAFYMGECYRNINDSKKAERSYSKAVKRNYETPSSILLLAEQLRKNGKYEEAIVEYENYRQLVPDDPKGDIGIASCKEALEWIQNPTRYEVTQMKDICSRDNDFCPSYASTSFNLIYFTSSRPAEEDKAGKPNPVSGMPFTDVFETRLDRQGEWSEPKQLGDTTINTEFDEGATNFNSEANTMYFTLCEITTGMDLGCKIMKSSKLGMEWGKATQVEVVSDSSISVGHPSISSDGLELYFAARMPGGVGGSDIWKCTREAESDSWGEPINVGTTINSPGDELYPYVRKDGNLYFSSDYWIGMGGLDIFKAIKDDDGFWIRSNMGYPVNSEQDDFGIVFQGKKESGLFTSGRPKGRGGDDIYSFVLPELKFIVEGMVTDKGHQKPIEEANITLIGSDGTILESKSKSDGTYRFELKQYTDYLVIGSGKGFLKKKTKVSTNNVVDDTTFVNNIELIGISEAVEIPNIFYDFGKWTLNESSMQALDELAELLEDNPNITIELGAHTDMVGDSASNMRLSMKRAESVINYLKDSGYDPERLVAKGYGESKPVVVDERLADTDTLFNVDEILSEAFILSLDSKELQEKVNQINRRTELKILSTNYIPKPEYFLRYKKNKMKMEEE